MFETDRMTLSRFRCGSHSLQIEIGRYVGIDRERRLCKCGTGIQTILHCFKDCPLVTHLLSKEYNNLCEIFADENISLLLYKICKELKVPIKSNSVCYIQSQTLSDGLSLVYIIKSIGYCWFISATNSYFQ